MPFKVILFSTLLLLGFQLRAQDDLPVLSADAADYLIEVSRAVDDNRYSEIRGTPYRYKEFKTVLLYDITLNKYTIDSANLNGFTSQFEYYVDGQLRELLPGNFIRADVYGTENGVHRYARGINHKFRDNYAEIVYKGENITATMIYNVINDEKIVQNVGKTLKLRRFSAKSLHFALVDGDLVPITMSPKKLAADLGFKKELTEFIKAGKLKPGTREDLLTIYKKADELVEMQ